MTRPHDSLEQLRQLLNEGAEPSLQEICVVLHITSERHARRLITRLRQNSVHVQDRRDGRIKRFYLEPEHRQATVRGFEFDEEEMLALAVAAEVAKAELGSTPLEEPLGRASISCFRNWLPRLTPSRWKSSAVAGTSAPRR